MEQATAIRSLEELQYLVRKTFDLLDEHNERVKRQGSWLIHILEKEDRLYVRNANLEKILEVVRKHFAEEHEDREMGIRTIKRDFKTLGIIVQANTPRTFTPKNEDGEDLEKVTCKVTVINLLAVDWIMDTPLLHDDTMAEMHGIAREQGKESWLAKWLEKTKVSGDE